MPSKLHSQFFQRALELAYLGAGHTRPNPPVGAVVVRDGEIIGEGYHHRAGEAHAEVMAMNDAREKGHDLKGAALYVTLEPCSKGGRVGACTEAIIAAGIGQVYYAVEDPNPKNRDRAIKELTKAGIECKRIGSLAARRLVAPFAKYITKQLPYVTVKIAMSLDGKICDKSGNAKWVSSEAARAATGKLREKVDAIMVGAETIRKDNPSLLSHGEPNEDLIRVVIARHAQRLPKDAQVFTDGKNKTLVFSSLQKAMTELARMGVMHVLCEGGLKLATSLAQAGFVDEWITVLAPKVIGNKPIAEAMLINRTVMIDDKMVNCEGK